MIEVQGSIKKPGAESHSITLAAIGVYRTRATSPLQMLTGGDGNTQRCSYSIVRNDVTGMGGPNDQAIGRE